MPDERKPVTLYVADGYYSNGHPRPLRAIKPIRVCGKTLECTLVGSNEHWFVPISRVFNQDGKRYGALLAGLGGINKRQDSK